MVKDPKMLNIEKNANLYAIRKRINDKRIYFGSFKNLKLAQAIRDILKQNDWTITDGVYFYNNMYWVLKREIYKTKGSKQIEYIGSYKTRKEAEEKLRTYEDKKYIKKTNEGYYLISTSINDKITYFGTYNTIEQAMEMRDDYIEHNWDKRYFQKRYKEEQERLANMYIFHDKKKYVIKKQTNGVWKTYGKYNTLKEAQYERDLLEQNNWEQEFEPDEYITKKLGKYHVIKNSPISGNPYKYTYAICDTQEEAIEIRNKLIKEGFPKEKIIRKDNSMRYIEENDGNYSIKKESNYKRTYYGVFNSKITAQNVRDILEKLNWKKPEDGIYENNGKYWVICRNKNDNLICETGCKTRKEAEELLSIQEIVPPEKRITKKRKDPAMKYIEVSSNKTYAIRKRINKKRTNYGTFKNKKEAQNIRDIIKNMNWEIPSTGIYENNNEFWILNRKENNKIESLGHYNNRKEAENVLKRMQKIDSI